MEDPKGKWVEIAKCRLSIPKLRLHYGVELCWACAGCAMPESNLEVVCPFAGKAGHEAGSALHRPNPAKRKEVIANMSKFKFGVTSEDAPAGND